MTNRTVKFESFHRQRINFSSSVRETRELALERWGIEIGSKEPSFFPGKDDFIFLFKGKGKSHPHFSDCFNALQTNGLFFPNVSGLVLLEVMDLEFNFLKPGSWVLGFDYLPYLNFEKKTGHFVPCLVKDDVSHYSHMFFQWNSKLESDEYVLAYEKGDN